MSATEAGGEGMRFPIGNLDWDYYWKNGGRWRVYDDPSPHGPTYLIAPCGTTMLVPDHNDGDVARSRAQWIADALNEKMGRAADPRPAPAEIPKKLLPLYRNDVNVAAPLDAYRRGHHSLTEALVESILHLAAMRDRCLDALLKEPPRPIKREDPRPAAVLSMILPCPRCRELHVDAPEPEKGWTNPPHKSHLCHYCGLVWRPADVPTNGVASIATSGKDDNWKPEQKAASGGKADFERVARAGVDADLGAGTFDALNDECRAHWLAVYGKAIAAMAATDGAGGGEG